MEPQLEPSLEYFKICEEWTAKVSETQDPNDAPTRRNVFCTNKLIDHHTSGHSSVFGLYRAATLKYSDKKLMGSRKLLNTFNETKLVDKVAGTDKKQVEKKWTYYELSGYTWLTYNECYEYSLLIAAGLSQLHLSNPDRFVIYTDTCQEWMLVFLAATSLGLQIVTCYDTLQTIGLVRCVTETKAKTIFTTSERLGSLVPLLKDFSDVHTLIYMGTPPSEELQRDIKLLGKQLYSLSELKELGVDVNFEPCPSGPEDTSMIMYTSGSTGNPKGVLISNSNMLSAISGLHDFVNVFTTTEDIMLCYLPLAHVLELMTELLCIHYGVTLAYGSIKTLGPDNMRNCKGDMMELKPTLMIGVPLVWDSIRAGIYYKLEELGWLKSKIFHLCAALKPQLELYGLPTSFIDKYIFSKVRSVVGGRLRLAISGGAPLSNRTQSLLSKAICPVIQGFGMTECTGIMSLQCPNNFLLGPVGSIASCLEMKMMPIPGTDYNNATDSGEIWVRGNSVFKGYLNDPVETANVLTEDGWFKTGDVGKWLSNGQLKIVDRIKNIIKLSNGEYIAIEKLESIYKLSLFVDNVCVFADSSYDKAVAVVSIKMPYLLKYIKNNNIYLETEALEDFDITSMIESDLVGIANSNDLSKREIIHDFYFTDEIWTPQNGFLTAANKLNRVQLHKHYQTHLNRLYN
ncbi:hypothetical protein BB561_002647 [Smittium simulii]|uniref:AMP-dependent synthetase/ligase domain-containing protein n=1 Tax=Smittium simulii TaxID=133385 RepID=A0A2T9YPX0_9FUNG|nr:hypothetical protein BB561_002647 [Smittium simulii]